MGPSVWTSGTSSCDVWRPAALSPSLSLWLLFKWTHCFSRLLMNWLEQNLSCWAMRPDAAELILFTCAAKLCESWGSFYLNSETWGAKWGHSFFYTVQRLVIYLVEHFIICLNLKERQNWLKKIGYLKIALQPRNNKIHSEGFPKCPPTSCTER